MPIYIISEMLSILEVVPFYIGRLILMTFNNTPVILTFASIDTGMQDALSAFFFYICHYKVHIVYIDLSST